MKYIRYCNSSQKSHPNIGPCLLVLTQSYRPSASESTLVNINDWYKNEWIKYLREKRAHDLQMFLTFFDINNIGADGRNFCNKKSNCDKDLLFTVTVYMI